MPSLGHVYAQRVRHPNGTCSEPFLVSMSLADMQRFSCRIIDGLWPENTRAIREAHEPADGVWTHRSISAMVAARRAADDFDSMSSRLACAHDGRYWSTARKWGLHCPISDRQIGDRLTGAAGRAAAGHARPSGMTDDDLVVVAGDAPGRKLYRDEVILLLHNGSDEAGHHALHSLGIADIHRALARTVLEWSKSIEEAWS